MLLFLSAGQALSGETAFYNNKISLVVTDLG